MTVSYLQEIDKTEVKILPSTYEIPGTDNKSVGIGFSRIA
jgi:hypothetical protein